MSSTKSPENNSDINNSTEASDLPKIQTNFGGRSNWSAEAKATKDLPIDKIDYQKATVLVSDPETGSKTISTESGKVLTLTKKQIQTLLSEPTI